MNVLRRLSLIVLSGGFVLAFSPEDNSFVQPAQAIDEDDCAIWLCLPGGFPNGCSAAYSAFKDRLKDRKPPLPQLSSCVVDGRTTGSYQLGYERYEPCGAGYVARDVRTSDEGRSSTQRLCINPQSCRTRGRDGDEYCSDTYAAPRRAKPNWVEMTVNGDPLGRYYYSMSR